MNESESEQVVQETNGATTPWAPSPAQIHRFRDAEAAAEAAVKRFVEAARKAVEREERFVVALAGGPSWRLVYDKLAQPPQRDEVPWDKTYFVFSDEACTAPDDESSHYRLARETLFDPLAIPAHRVLRMKGEQAPLEAARRYAVRLGDLFLNQTKRHLDLALLDIDEDGSTASLLPGTAALEERESWVAAVQVPGRESWRLTLTLPALNSARRVLFLATGEDKARVIAEAFGDAAHDPPHPCELVAPPHARREVLIDEAAASRL